MRTIAFYLPQFHRIKENDLWWGNGYTEWTAVKAAKPLFEGHYQPRVPLQENYYDLLDKDTFLMQERLMKQYGVDALCIYHYYFADGKKLLEKPAENLLNWKDIDIQFCFSWANETWARSWAKLTDKNIWNKKEEENTKQKSNDGILVKQEYGTEKDWQAHFNYLLPFFKDERYLKKDNKPVFVIHKADLISCLPQMLKTWNDMARENSFDGIFIIASNADIKGLDAYLRQEPNFSAMNKFVQEYKRLSNCIVAHALDAGDDTFVCGCPSYDDTPRRGTEGIVYDNSTPELFYEQMKDLYAIAEAKKQDYVFVNAWNEWGEGMYLEPDEKYGVSYLDAIWRAKEQYNLSSKVEVYRKKLYEDNLSDCKNQMNYGNAKLEAKTLYKLISIDRIEDRIHRMFIEDKKTDVAIYGLGRMGVTVADLFTRSGVDIKYGIDRRPEKIHVDFPMFSPRDELPHADMIVVCVPLYFKEIYDEMNGIGIEIISIDNMAELLEKVEV